MADIEKVIKRLSELHGSSETMKLISETIAMLKEQKQKIDVLEDQNARLIRQKQERFQQNWIPISEKYPKSGELVLLSYPAYTAACGDEYVEGVGCGYLIETALNKYWARSDGLVIGELGFSPVDPVAWMPLPEPQKQ